MRLNCAEKFLILIYNSNGHTEFTVVKPVVQIGLIASILLDLQKSSNVELANNQFTVIKKHTDLSNAHKMLLNNLIRINKQLELKEIISHYSKLGQKLKMNVVEQLRKKGIVKLSVKNFLLFKLKTSYLTAENLRNDIKSETRKTLFSETVNVETLEPIERLIVAFGFHKTIMKNRSEIDFVSSRFNELIKRDSVLKDLEKIADKYNSINKAWIMPPP